MIAKKGASRLATEIEFYTVHKHEWLEAHSEKYVVIKGSNVAGFYPSFETALRAGIGAFGVSTDFLVRQMLEHEPVFFVF